MTAETRASSGEVPLPCETVRVLAAGRTAITTGTPRVSSPVTSATRVMPKASRRPSMTAQVSSGRRTRCVPSK